MKLLAAVVIAAAAVAQAGPTAKPPHGADRIEIDYSRITLHHRARRQITLAWDGEAYIADNHQRVDAALIVALYAALAPTREVPERLACNSHTDDYSAFEIAIEGDDPVELSSTSNCAAYVPWNIQRNAKLFVQFSGDAWKALAPIFAAVDTGLNVEPWHHDGGEVLLAIYSPAEGASTGDAETCARSLEANAQVRRFFAAPIRVEQLGLVCELATSPDCAVPQASGTIVFGGLAVHVELTCANGVATPSLRSLATYKPALGFVASKPVRALVAAMGSATTPLVFDGYSWAIDPDTAGLPRLSWVPGETTMWLHAIGDAAPNPAFWKALAIDPAPLVGTVGGTNVIDEKIDFAGAIVR
jgi:hypothetical protein